ncbi:MAG: peptidoglycan DD-metalloendopeptidase family protein [bacterium]|nr:peptidoglycan DD-metalloendopeptidase family protein [bacterium]
MPYSLKNIALTFIFATLTVQGFFLVLFGMEEKTTTQIATIQNETLQKEIQQTFETTTQTSQLSVLTDFNPKPESEISQATKTNPSQLVPQAISTKSRGLFLEYTVKMGDTISSIWTKIGGKGGCDQIVKAFSAVGITPKSLRAGETIRYVKSDSGDIDEIHKPLEEAKVLILKKESENEYSSLIHQPKILIKERPVVGIIEKSFAEAALHAEVPYEMVDDYVDLFSGRIEFRKDLQPGDEFTLIYEERRLEDGGFVSPGNIIAASLKSEGRVMAAVRYKGKDGIFRYYDEDGESLEKAFLRYPLTFTRISSIFSTSRFHPVLKIRRPHNGVDFSAPTGTPVRAVADGVVMLAGWSGGGGRTIKLQHGSRYATAYLHLSKISPTVKRGARVKRGQIIGNVGKTGLATGPHLHFSFYDRGRYVDPLKIKLPKLEEGPGFRIPKDYLMAALHTIEFYHKNDAVIATNKTDSAKPYL